MMIQLKNKPHNREKCYSTILRGMRESNVNRPRVKWVW